MQRNSRLIAVIATVAFFLSGASSLVFQTIWSRLLSHVFGSSSVAISSVVSVFMAGLGLGAYWFGKRADRIADPLLTYALAELGVGAFSLCIPWIVRGDGYLALLNAWLRNHFGTQTTAFMLGRFACIVPVLLVPTVLMGSTLPLLARYFVQRRASAAHASRQIGQLYAVNTAGAVMGVLLGSFVLLPHFGVATANRLAACTNFTLAATITLLRWLSRRAPAEPTGATAAVPSEPSPELRGASDVTETPASQAHSSLRIRRAAALAFAGSGFASLLYEVVWSRALINTIGGSLYSFALILTTFLVGIALGSTLASSLGQSERRPIVPAAMAAALLTLMAAAPLLAHGGVTTAVLAALAGCAGIAAVFWLGHVRAARDAIFDDAVFADAAFDAAADDTDGTDAGKQTRAAASPRDDRGAELWAVAVPVLLALIVTLTAPSRLAHVVLAVVCTSAVLIAGLLALRERPLLLLIGLQLFIAGATFVSDLFADELSLTFASMVAPLYEALPRHVATVQGLMFVTAALCVLPSALGMGAVFPVTLRVWTQGGAQIGQDIGVIYTGNTIGSIIGAWLPGFILMPMLGMQAALHIGISVNLAIALGLCVVAGWSRSRAPADAADGGSADFALGTDRVMSGSVRAVALLGPWLLAALVFCTLRPPEWLAWNISKMTLGAFRISLARDVLDEESWGAPDLVYYHDGLSTTVTVERWGRHFSLKNNGKVDASNGDDMPTQIMVSALPLLLHEHGPRGLDVAIVGFGSGVTVGAALQFPVHAIDVVELERSTIEASRFFADVNHLHYVSTSFPYVSEPRLHVYGDDGRNYLAATPKHFDVIVSEPSNPWLTGVSDLFTRDHFVTSKRKLKPGGIYCQWAQLYELSPDNVKIIYRTFAEQFRYVVVFSAEDLSSDTVLIGSDSPLPLDLTRLTRAFAEPHVAAELERAYVHTPFDVFGRVLLANKQEVLKFSAGAPINTDDNARIELAAPRDLIGFERYKGYLETMYMRSFPYANVAPELRGFGAGPVGSSNLAQQALSLLAHGRKRQAAPVIAQAQAQGPSPELALVQSMYDQLNDGRGEPALMLSDEPAPSDAAPRLRELLAQSYAAMREALEAGDMKRALDQLERVPEHVRRDVAGPFDLAEGYLLYKTKNADEAIELFEGLVRKDAGFVREHPELYCFLARAHDALLHFDKAVRNMRVCVERQAAAVHGAADVEPVKL